MFKVQVKLNVPAQSLHDCFKQELSRYGFKEAGSKHVLETDTIFEDMRVVDFYKKNIGHFCNSITARRV